MTEQSEKLLKFLDYELDLAARVLRRDGEPVALEPRVFDLLAWLIEQRHRAVDKDEIQDAVWTGMIVSETALTRAIMKARRAVGDSADRQAVIRTVHGHGYQFVAELQTPGDEEAADESPVPAFGASTSSPKPRMLSAIGVLAALVVMTLIWVLIPNTATSGSVRLAILPVDNQTGDMEYDWTRLGLMGFAREVVAQSESLDVVAASDVVRFAEVNGLPDDDSAVAALQDMRGLYGANHMLTSRLESDANMLRLTYALYGPNGSVERGTMVGAEPTQLMRGMIRSVTGSLGDRVGGAEEITVISEDPFVNEAFSRGLALSLEGRCAEALELFDVVRRNVSGVTRADYEWASCARILGQWQEAQAGFERILEETPAEPSSSLRASAYLGLGTVFIRTGRAEAARETLALGLIEAQQAGDRELEGKILNNQAIEARDRREYDEARELLARARVAHSEANAGIIPGQLPAALANIDMYEGKLDQADMHLTQALEAFRALGDRRNEAMMLNNTGYLRRLQGRVDEAEPYHLQSLEIRREIGDRVGQGRILGMLSILYQGSGRLEEAVAAASEAFEIASEANDRLFMATSLAQLAQAMLVSGDVQDARDAFADSGEIFREINDYSRAAQTSLRLAQIDMRLGDLESAEAGASEVLELSLRELFHEPAIEAMEVLGSIAVEQNAPEQAIAHWQDAIEHIDETGFLARKDDIVLKLADLHLDRNEADAVEPLIGYLIEHDESPASVRTQARYAYLRGDTTRAVELMESAEALAGDAWRDEDAALLTEYREAAQD